MGAFFVVCNGVEMGIFLNAETRPTDGLEIVWFVDDEGKIHNTVKKDITLTGPFTGVSSLYTGDYAKVK